MRCSRGFYSATHRVRARSPRKSAAFSAGRKSPASTTGTPRPEPFRPGEESPTDRRVTVELERYPVAETADIIDEGRLDLFAEALHADVAEAEKGWNMRIARTAAEHSSELYSHVLKALPTFSNSSVFTTRCGVRDRSRRPNSRFFVKRLMYSATMHSRALGVCSFRLTRTSVLRLKHSFVGLIPITGLIAVMVVGRLFGRRWQSGIA